MATKEYFKIEEISKTNPIFSPMRMTVETAFYRNNVELVTSPKEAYKLAESSPGTIVTSWEVYKPEMLGLDKETRILLFNDGAVTGRYAAGRRILGTADDKKYLEIVREAVYRTRYRKMYHGISFSGLSKEFMVKNHILIPEGHENLLYNWILNFQYPSPEYEKMYSESKEYSEGDIYVFVDPDWTHPDYPLGLAIFDPEHNCAAILGMRYFGELKKGTLTLAWSIANRNNFVSCHGGLKRLKNSKVDFVAAFFGLSGSGKSTLTHAKHSDYEVTVLHDDAFIISTEDLSSVALEPSYFDKTADYPSIFDDNKYLLTIQNCGATKDENGNIVPVMEDLRNGNGRAIKSKLWSPNRVDRIKSPIDAIFWLMKDPILPPIVKVESPSVASSMGALLTTKRTSAEKLDSSVDPSALVFEPYANPFRTYLLSEDYYKFKLLFEKGVACYILNTGYFLDKKVPKRLTIKLVEKVVEDKINWIKWFDGFYYADLDDFVPDMQDKTYLLSLKQSFLKRKDFVLSKVGTRDELPKEVLTAIDGIIGLL
ncbi:phosphoenolpyruvate carboxykinase [Thermosipho melanesiensis]|nr:phosphoenolpyruvate carboxykinase (ATP) [Thermosipho melanesiensis]APT74185.1 phosphoenolpyruvate carboxykinase [Thermosipho melanesiensis]OOC36129.1 phosphoenolpyruvate carboxykinase [Thermosipho melanesiensis]OOC36946.1 phosphoenolpyruvate carboxykinase [Thermosipho melanesiensis]OOC37698.1 phosphoenolpyruvate carboxykinase [Thermosipho melanesiensis]OOC40925.1 phosphoenolpyruvate carboxykinase [Thermosipho melanesiensis]